MEAPKPGFYRGVSFEDYSRWDAVNHSRLRHLDKTPFHARYEELHPRESSNYQELGHNIHAALLEPERFEDTFIVAPDVDRRTKAGKAIWAEHVAKANGKTVLTESDYACLEGLKANAALHETINGVLYGKGESELSIVWVDQETGLLCKARLDRLTKIGSWPFVIDVKSTHAPAATYTWQTAVNKYRLHQQAAHYLNGIQAVAPLEGGEYARKFAWIVCETVGPYAVRIFEADDRALEIGRDEVARNLAKYKACKESGVWPSWDQGMEIVGLPPWAMSRYDLD